MMSAFRPRQLSIALSGKAKEVWRVVVRRACAEREEEIEGKHITKATSQNPSTRAFRFQVEQGGRIRQNSFFQVFSLQNNNILKLLEH